MPNATIKIIHTSNNNAPGTVFPHSATPAEIVHLKYIGTPSQGRDLTFFFFASPRLASTRLLLSIGLLLALSLTRKTRLFCLVFRSAACTCLLPWSASADGCAGTSPTPVLRCFRWTIIACFFFSLIASTCVPACVSVCVCMRVLVNFSLYSRCE